MLTNKKRLIILAAVFLGLGVAVPWALARMDPLQEVKVQIKKPNMLVVFDVSGSMQGDVGGHTLTDGMENVASRMYKAKQVITNIIPDVKYMVNLGFMTYTQSTVSHNFPRGYYPYKVSATGTSTPTETHFDYHWLHEHHLFPLPPSSPWGPAASFTDNGTLYTLCNSAAAGCSHGANSRFTREEGHGHDSVRYTSYFNFTSSNCYVDHDTVRCTNGGQTWTYQESYYVYDQAVVSTNVEYFLKYYGRQFTDTDGTIGGKAGLSYVYYTFNSYSQTCGASGGSSCPVYGSGSGQGNGLLLVPINTAGDIAAQDAVATKILDRMSFANEGGLVATGYTPTGATLKNADADAAVGQLKKLFGTWIVGDGTTTPPATIYSEGITWTLTSTQYTRSSTLCERTVSPIYNGRTYVNNSTSACNNTGTGNTWTFSGAYYLGPNISEIKWNDAYSYFNQAVIHNDQASKEGCRKNFVLLVTDGEPNGPDISSTTDAQCAGNTALDGGDPDASRCGAKWLFKMQTDGYYTPVTTYVVGFGSDSSGSATLNDIARYGGSPLKADGNYAYYAGDEAALEAAIREIINKAAEGDYATAPPSYTFAQGGTGTVVFFSSAKYPEWNGHLRAVDAANNRLLWDAGQKLTDRTTPRNIYTSDPANTPAYPIAFTDSNLSAIQDLGLGAASDDEARAIIYFIHGAGREWRLGDIVNSAPATLVPPPWRQLNAFNYQNFFDTYGYLNVSGQWVPQRNIVVFTGANDGMLHAFTMASVTSGGTTLQAGDEVWAYIPPDLIPKLKTLYLNNGQIAAANDHLYYVAASPKIQDICVDTSSPEDGICDAWKTALISGEGPGGPHAFMLDVTHPSPNDPNYDSSNPFTVLWTTSNADNTGLRTDLEKLGQTFSNPAFGKVRYMNGSLEVSEDAIFMGSGYDNINPGNVSHGGVGTTVYILRAQDGTPIRSFDAGDAPSGAITEFSLLSNTVAYGYGSMFGWSTVVGGADTWKLSELLQADLGGRIWTVITSADTDENAWTMTESYDAGSGQPFYYSPAMATIPTSGAGQYINVMAAISGAYSDPDMDPYGAGSGFTPQVFLLQNNNGTITDFPGFPKTINNFQKTVGGANFPTSARPTGSPLLTIDDNDTPDDPSDDFIGVILTIYIPSNSSCGFGEGYIVILKITGLYDNGVSGATVTEAYAQKVSDSMPSPPFIVRGALVMTSSGRGTASAQITTIGNVGTVTTTTGNAKFLYWKEVR